jgi:hypothetical protein
LDTFFPGTDNLNHIRGDTVLRGNNINVGNFTVGGVITLKGGSSELNLGNRPSLLPALSDNKNYIRGDTQVEGHANFTGNLTISGVLCMGGMCLSAYDLQKIKELILHHH